MGAPPVNPSDNPITATLNESEDELYARTRLKESPLSQIQDHFKPLNSFITPDAYKQPEPLRSEEYGIIQLSLRDLLAFLILHNPEIKISQLCNCLEAEISTIRAIGAEYIAHVKPL